MVKARFDAEVPNLPQVIDFVNEALSGDGWDQETLAVMDVAVEEIFVNIASYAYATLPGAEKFADITVDLDDEGVTVILEDAGVEYNPLLTEEPDVTLPSKDRSIGGLGIYMVKMSMDKVEYERKDGRNVFTIRKVKPAAKG